MYTWIEPEEVFVPSELAAAVGGHPLVAATLARRGITDPRAAAAFLDPFRYTPAAPDELPGLAEGAARIDAALRRGESILVWGDFDVDGQTSTALLVEALRELGGRASYHIPIRESESHGVNVPGLERALDASGARLVVTCDTGVSAHAAVAYANARGVDVVITDHHDLPEQLPPALAVVEPKRLPADHPLYPLSGVGVAYLLAKSLLDAAGKPAAAQRLLDLVALGLVADLAEQRGDVRYLIQLGLRALRQTERAGLHALAELAELDLASATEEHIGFVIGPRLNALGRLADANPAVEFFTTPDLTRARILAAELEGLNARRKLLTAQVFQAAQAQIQQDRELLEKPVLVLSHPAWPAGVIGIVASRLVELYGRPAVLLAAPPDQPARGSARSVEGCNITAAIATQADLLLGFGGHPMAAGLALDAANLPAFRRGLERAVGAVLGATPPAPTLRIDAYSPLSTASVELAHELERLAPFGQGNPSLVLAERDLRLASTRSLGRDDEHLVLTLEDTAGHSYRVLWWQGAGVEQPSGRFDLAYTLRASDFRGRPEAQIEWVDARPIAPAGGIVLDERPTLQYADLRNGPQPLFALQQILTAGDVQVWGEALAPGSDVPARDRLRLEPGAALVVWTIPPGPDELSAAVRRAAPGKLYWFAADPGMDAPTAFLERLVGLCKYALRARSGLVSIEALAAACAQRPAVIRAGLDWLLARGYFGLTHDAGGDELTLTNGDRRENPAAGAADARLRALLAETAAFRDYYRRAGPDALAAMIQLGR